MLYHIAEKRILLCTAIKNVFIHKKIFEISLNSNIHFSFTFMSWNIEARKKEIMGILLPTAIAWGILLYVG